MLLPQTKGRRLQRVTLKADQVEMALQVDQAIALLPEQSHYLCNVLRLETGSEFIALDRRGGWWLAQLVDHGLAAKIIGKLENNSELLAPVTLGIAMPKGNHLEDVIRQTTELGVKQIMPLSSDRTVIKAGQEVGNQKRDRWQRIAEEAAELSMRTHIPEVHPPQTLETWLNVESAAKPPSLAYIAVTKPDAPHLLTCLQNTYPQKSSETQILAIAIATGCEGGWTDREEKMAIAAGFIPVSLGDRVLSAVTAPVVALSIVGAFLDTLEQ
ncbi:MAG: 16S rRNA (uracil(1498)-N(3))-methyltransferase [Pseudanabaena sp.]|nr:MAG: 16S rRNA (uracil(1498)-N(3))-methyltransferase [Pseudanabaena sp.]